MIFTVRPREFVEEENLHGGLGPDCADADRERLLFKTACQRLPQTCKTPAQVSKLPMPDPPPLVFSTVLHAIHCLVQSSSS